jgi:hypothetical protein
MAASRQLVTIRERGLGRAGARDAAEVRPMSLPFTVEQFLDVFRRYNEAVWPAQWALAALGVVAVVLAVRPGRHGGRAVAAILAALWLWMGAVYHLGFFRAINPAAALFGAAFLAQAALLLWLGVARGRMTFRVRPDVAGVAGALLVLYALVAYPALDYVLGHRYPTAPTFGLPCPTTILTLALLLWATPAAPRILFAVPLLWAAVGTSAAVQLGMLEDFGLLAAAVACTGILVGGAIRTRRAARRLRPA